MTVSPKIKKAWDIISGILVTIVVIFAVLLMGARVVGLEVRNVVSGSMEPTYSVGDLLYIRNVSPDAVKVGDPITFVLNKDLVVATHRVIEVDMQNRCFYTQGDANDTPDAKPVLFENLLGVPVFAVPYLGYVSDFILKPPGTYIAIGGMALLVAVVFLPDLFKKQSAPEEIKKAEPQGEPPVPQGENNQIKEDDSQ